MANYRKYSGPYASSYNNTPYPMRVNQPMQQIKYPKRSGAEIKNMVAYGWRASRSNGLMKFVGSPKDSSKIQNNTGNIVGMIETSRGIKTNLYESKGKYFVLFTIWVHFEDGRKVPTNGILTGFDMNGHFHEKEARLRMPDMNLIASFSSYGHTSSGKSTHGFWGKVSRR